MQVFLTPNSLLINTVGDDHKVSADEVRVVMCNGDFIQFLVRASYA